MRAIEPDLEFPEWEKVMSPKGRPMYWRSVAGKIRLLSEPPIQ